jgi:hypothetical protein
VPAVGPADATKSCITARAAGSAWEEWSIASGLRGLEPAGENIRDVDRIAETTETARALYGQVLALYPGRVDPSMLWWSARTLKPGP